MFKFCPVCGAPAPPGATACEACGQEWDESSGAVAPPIAPSATTAVTVADLSPKALRREIRWGVFQGLLLVAAIVLAVYLVVILLALSLFSASSVTSGMG